MTTSREVLVVQLREAEEALLDAEDDLRRKRRLESAAAARVNTAALCVATLHRAIETLDEVPGVVLRH